MLVDGFDELGTMASIYNHPYYPEYMEKHGYQKEIDWVEFEIKIPKKVPEKIERIANISLQRNKLKVLKTRKRKDLLPYAKDMFNVLNMSYENIFGFVPLTEKQIDVYVKQYFGFIRPEYISMILDKDDRVAAFGITMPSFSKALQKAKGRLFPFGFIHMLKAMKNNDVIDLYIIGVRPDMQGKGVNAIMFNEIMKIIINKKFVKAETNFELENNYKVHALWKYFEKRQHKRRRCYIKHMG